MIGDVTQQSAANTSFTFYDDNIAPNEQVRVYRFDKNGQTVWAAWIKATSGTQQINLDTNGRTVRVISLFGDDLGTFGGGNLTLGAWPIYLTTDLGWNQNIGRITGRVHTTAHVWANRTSGEAYDRHWIVKQEIENKKPVGFQGIALNRRRPLCVPGKLNHLLMWAGRSGLADWAIPLVVRK